MTNKDIEVALTLIAPYDWESIIAFLRARAIPGVESTGADEYRRTIAIGGEHGVIRVVHDGGSLSVFLPARFASSQQSIIDRISSLFDLSAGPETIGAHLGRDPLLQPLVRRRPGIRVPGAWDPFELAVRAVIGQQVSVAGATTVAGRLVEAHGTRIATGDPSLAFLFPAPALLAEAGIAGMPRRRAETIRTVARAFAGGPVDSARLAALRGIGPWTVNYVALRAWKDPDAFPAGDLALRRAAGGISERELEARSAAWRPWRAYAAMLLWNSL